VRYRPMTRIPLIALNLFAGTSLLLAQAPQNSGWRRFNDPPPAPAPAPQAQKAAPGVQEQDPSQPVARADSYGQPQQEQQEQQEQPVQQPQPRRNDRPPAAAAVA